MQTISCRHYVSAQRAYFRGNVVDPDGRLELFEASALVTVVVEVTAPDGQLVVREAYPCSEAVVRHLQDAGLTLWFAEEHAAWTDQGWIDVEALEGEPMERPHR